MLIKFILASIITVLGFNKRHNDTLKDNKRLNRIATVFATTIQTNQDLNKFIGPAKDYAAATLFVATAFRESGFRKSVQYCFVKGDQGRSISLFQLMKPWALRAKVIDSKGRTRWVKKYTEQQICNSLKLQSHRFFYLHSHIQSTSKHHVPANWFAIYYSGKSRRIRVTDSACMKWSRLTKRMGIIGADCNKINKMTFEQNFKLKTINVLNKFNKGK